MKVMLLFCVLLVLFSFSDAQFFTNTAISQTSTAAGASTSITVSFDYTLASGLGSGDNFYIILPAYATAWDITGWQASCSAPSACSGCRFNPNPPAAPVATGTTYRFNLRLGMNYCYGYFTFTISNIKNPSAPGNSTAQGEVGAFNAPGKFNGVAITAALPPTPSPCGTAVIGTGTGLRGDYYSGINFNTALGVRRDSTINFNWDQAGPGFSGAPASVFSTRWSGTLYAKFTGSHTFYTTSDDGVRLFIDGVSVIGLWTDHSPTESTGTYNLVAGQAYSVLLEYYNNVGGSMITLSWAAPACGLAKEIIPATQFTPKPFTICN